MQIPSGFLIYAEEAKPSINQDSCQDSSYDECSSSTHTKVERKYYLHRF